MSLARGSVALTEPCGGFNMEDTLDPVVKKFVDQLGFALHSARQETRQELYEDLQKVHGVYALPDQATDLMLRLVKIKDAREAELKKGGAQS